MTKILGDIMKNKTITVIMTLILILSLVTLIVNISTGHKFNEIISQKYEYTQTTLYSDENDLYSGSQYIENKIFEKYFVVGIGTRVNYTGFVEEPGILNTSDDKQNLCVKEEMAVNNVTYSSSYNGEEAEEGKEYITINVTSYNNENYGRLVRFSANLSYNTDLKDFKFEQEKLYREAKYDYPEEVDTYGFRFDDALNKTVMVKNKSDDVNMFYIAPDSSVTYNVTYEIDKGQRNGLALRCYNNKDLRSNSDYIILLY